MDIIDWFLVGVVLIFALLGYASGALRQILKLLGLALSIFVGFLVYITFENLLLVPVAVILTSIAFSITVYIVKKIFPPRPDWIPEYSVSSRITGALIAGLKGTAIVFIFLASLHLSLGFLNRMTPVISDNLEKSLFYNQFKKFSSLSSNKAIRNIYYIGEMTKKGQKTAVGNYTNVLKDLRNNPKLKSILRDSELMKKIQSQDFKGVLSDKKFLELLNDKEFLHHMHNIDLESVYNNTKKRQQEK